MSTDVGSESSPVQAHGAPSGPWLTRALLVVGAIAVLGAAAQWMPRSVPSQEIGPVLTHTVARGDLIVTLLQAGELAAKKGHTVTNET